MTGDSSQQSPQVLRVLICDDYEPLRAVLRDLIDLQHGLTVVGDAADGDEAIAEAHRLQPDVILLDLSMPRKTGLAALDDILIVAPHAKVIVFSGFSIGSVGEDVLAAGAVMYLQKGARPEAIIDAIEHAALLPSTAARLAD